MIRELSEDWGVDFVFSTATQPAFERRSVKPDLRWEPGTLTEIVRDPAPLRAALKRAEIHWEIEHAMTGHRWPHARWAGRNARDRQPARPRGRAVPEVLRAALERGSKRKPSSTYPRACARRTACGKSRKTGTAPARRPPLLCGHFHAIGGGRRRSGFPLVLRALAPLEFHCPSRGPCGG